MLIGAAGLFRETSSGKDFLNVKMPPILKIRTLAIAELQIVTVIIYNLRNG